MGTTVFATTTAPGPPGPTGPAGYSPVYIVAAGPPSNAIGNNGDMYIDSTNGNTYGPKVSGSWGAVVCNIKGSTGATGAQGPPGYSPLYIVAAGPPGGGVGNNGDMYIDSATSDVYGPKTSGTWGGIRCNIKGNTGAQGPPGISYTPKGAWSSATNYTQGDQVTSGNQLYISLQGPPNLNHDPATSPTYWQAVGTGGGAQTPWLTNIEAAGFNLNNAGKIGIGTSPTLPLTILQAPQDPSLTASTGMLMMYGTSGVTLAAGISTGGQAWLQGKFSTVGDGRSFPISLQPLGGNVGIGTGALTPLGELHVASVSTTSVTRGITSAQYSDSVQAARVAMVKYRGSVAAPVAIQSGDYLGAVTFTGSTSTGGLIDGAAIQCVTTGVITNGIASDLIFATNPGSAGVTVGTERMRITAAGNVGIGTNNPFYRLSVVGNRSVFASGLDTYAIGIRYQDGSPVFWMGSDLNGDCIFSEAGGAERMRIRATGFVGIGTAGATQLLSLRLATGGNPVNAGSGTAQTGGFVLDAATGGNGLYMGVQAGGANGAWIQATDRNNYALVYPLLLQPNGGNIGIGTASPNSIFDISNTAVSDTPGTTFQSGYSYGGVATFGWRIGTGNASLNLDALGGGWNAILSINRSNARIGILKASPAYTLDITGDCNLSAGSVYRINGVPISGGGITTKSFPPRSLNTVYQNGAKWTFVQVVATVNANTYMQFVSDGTNPPGTVLCSMTNSSTGVTAVYTVSGWVAPGEFYKANTPGASILAWVEWN